MLLLNVKTETIEILITIGNMKAKLESMIAKLSDLKAMICKNK